MEIVNNNDGTITIKDVKDFSLKKTLESGQCFRFEESNGVYLVQSKDRIAAMVQRTPDKVVFKATQNEVEDYWMNYLNMKQDYSKIEELTSNSRFLTEAREYSKGLKILNQDPWETLVCFILSQRNNIPKIKSTVKKLCEHCGSQIVFEGKTYFAFPTPEELRSGLEKYGESLSLGYRLQYLVEASTKVITGELKLEELKNTVCSYEKALMELEGLFGVGPKVANCVALFGLGHTEAFPIDVWIQRVIDTYFDGNLDITPFGEYAGIIQQFMFFYGKYLGR